MAGKEFAVKKNTYPDGYVRAIIDYILHYLQSENKSIANLETFGCGSWLFQFVFNGDYIELHELKDVVSGENKYEFDLTLTINFFKEQADLCNANNIQPDIPRIGQKVAIASEIYDGSEVNGVRYSAPEHMTGWYLTANSYNGDIKSLQVDHLYHVLKARPDLAKFLALPAGFRFYKNGVEEDVWADDAIVD